MCQKKVPILAARIQTSNFTSWFCFVLYKTASTVQFVQTFSLIWFEIKTWKKSCSFKMSEPPAEDKETIVTTIRANVKENIRIARLKHRHDEVDNFRITLGDAEDSSAINLQTFNNADILAIANQIKRKRHAPPTELMKLSHAFLQSIENISYFVKITGALAVIIKEMTGKWKWLVWSLYFLALLSIDIWFHFIRR